LQKIGWSRAARTDKGVHAVANFVNCKLAITEKFLKRDETEDVEENKNEPQEVDKVKDKEKIDWEKVINVINSNLPDSIRVHSTFFVIWIE